ncbi:LysR family transcriptional regulator [Paenibacillus sp. N1-5-1-14]|uniref:LysR family transcriptional regulator n=1 Tax=Paenibacillus radicibacter TaxID=2972488 RepID=UPI002158A390|nr:LysR family transcriptional regulator [Paenibacillus radicibacter]MCR8643127.1 LysR family transcriptional regulator [Paenibacillus radicibacter]
MDIQWLRTFVSTAQHENFRKAAEQLYLAQPTVTMHIKHLEELLGISLFERRGRNVHLSQAGRRFLPYAEGMIHTLETGVHDLESWRQGYRKKIRIAVSPLVAASTLPPIVSRFLAEHTDIEVAIEVMESLEIGEAVIRGSADIGLTRMRPPQVGLHTQKLKEDPVLLIVPHDGSDFETAPHMDLEAILQNHLILTHNHPEYWDTLLNVIRIKYPRIRTMKVSQVYITKRFIEEGLGISFLPRSTVIRELMEGRVLEVNPDDLVLPVASTYLVHRNETEEIEQFMQFIIDFYS